MTAQSEILFDTAAFPVIKTDRTGIVRYKNPAAARALPMLRRGASPARHLYGGALSAGVLYLLGETAYPRAIALPWENGLHCLFLSCLQYANGEETAQALFRRYEDRPQELMTDFLRLRAAVVQTDGKLPLARTDADLIALLGNEDVCADTQVVEPYALFARLSTRLSGALRGIGFRVRLEADESLKALSPVRLDVSGFLYRCGRLLYAMMKLSKTGIIDGKAIRDEQSGAPMLLLSTRTTLSHRNAETEDAFSLLSALLPECAVEFAMLRSISDEPDAMRLSVNEYGKTTLSYRLRAAAPSELSVRAVDVETAVPDALLRMVLRSLRTSLTA